MRSSTYYFHMKTKILADFQICISVPLSLGASFIEQLHKTTLSTFQEILIKTAMASVSTRVTGFHRCLSQNLSKSRQQLFFKEQKDLNFFSISLVFTKLRLKCKVE